MQERSKTLTSEQLGELEQIGRSKLRGRTSQAKKSLYLENQEREQKPFQTLGYQLILILT